MEHFPQFPSRTQRGNISYNRKAMICDICSKQFFRESNYKKHLQRHELGYDCSICFKPHGRLEDLIIHQQDLHSLIGHGEKSDFDPVFKITPKQEKHNNKFRIIQKTYTATLENKDRLVPSTENINILFNNLLSHLTEKVPDNDLIGLTLTSPSLDYPVSIPLKRKSNLSARDVLDHIESILNSNQDFRIDNRLKIDVMHSQIPEGRGGKPLALYKNKDDAVNKKGVSLL